MTAPEALFGRTPLVIVEIDHEVCSRTYGVAPCTAAVGTTGTTKCFNGRGTCQDHPNYLASATPLTLKFCEAHADIPTDQYIIPSLKSVSTSPTRINVGGRTGRDKPLGRRAECTVGFIDHPHSDNLVDPYPADRDYNPLERGEFWAKWVRRNPYSNNWPLRIREGYVGQPLGEMQVRNYLIDKVDGPDSKGKVTIRGVDVLRLADDDKAKCPPLSSGKLLSAITNSATTLTITGAKFSDYTNVSLIDDCEDLWDESVDADVTVSLSTDSKVGTYSNKFVVAAAAAAGDILATEAIPALDISTATRVRFWIKSSVATAAGDLQLLLSESANAATPAETLNVPALTANTWTDVYVPLASAAADRNAIISVGLKCAVDIGACDIYIDDINAFSTNPIRIENEIMRFTDIVVSAGDLAVSGVSRGTDGTKADAHDAEDTVQACVEFISQEPWLVAKILLEKFGGVSSAWIPYSDWVSECSTWLQGLVVSRLISHPEGVTDLLGQLTEQCMFYIWWDERSQQIKLRAVRPATGVVPYLTEDNHLIQNSVSIRCYPEYRASEVWVSFLQRNAAEAINKRENYRRTNARVDKLNFYKERRVYEIFSPWLRSNAHIDLLTFRLLSRYRNPPKNIHFSLDAKDRSIGVGDIIDIEYRGFTDTTGKTTAIRYQVISAHESPPGEMIKIEAQKFDFDIGTRYSFWMVDTAPLYSAATDAEKDNGCWWAEADGRMTNGDDGYVWS